MSVPKRKEKTSQRRADDVQTSPQRLTCWPFAEKEPVPSKVTAASWMAPPPREPGRAGQILSRGWLHQGKKRKREGKKRAETVQTAPVQPDQLKWPRERRTIVTHPAPPPPPPEPMTISPHESDAMAVVGPGMAERSPPLRLSGSPRPPWAWEDRGSQAHVALEQPRAHSRSSEAFRSDARRTEVRKEPPPPPAP